MIALTPVSSTGLAPSTSATVLALATFGELMESPRWLPGRSWCRRNYRGHPEDILLAVQLGSEVDLRPMQALQIIAVIKHHHLPHRPRMADCLGQAGARLQSGCRRSRVWPGCRRHLDHPARSRSGARDTP